MKRKASQFLGSELPAKLTKESTHKTVNQTLTLLKKDKTIAKTPLQPAKWPSFSQTTGTSQRQRKAPSWLASYVTNSAQEKEVKKEKPKPKLPRFPTLVPPSKQKEKAKDVKSEETTLLRRQSTLKLPSSPTALSSKSTQNKILPQASLSRKSTEILNSSSENLHRKYTKCPTAGKKISVLGKDPPKVSVSPDVSETKSRVKRTTSLSQKHEANDKINNTRNAHNCSSNVVEICDGKNISNHSGTNTDFESASTRISKPNLIPSSRSSLQNCNTLLLPEEARRPNMLEVVISISTSGAMRDYLAVLQDRIREMIWRLQSLVPNLRIGVMAHTQGGIHDDQTRVSCGSGDHNYNRVGGHGGTKWLDLGATLSQICAFVDSLDTEPTVYPDYVQDNLEMALWKLQRCMSWSSCSYRTVIMIGRGRPNRTSFYMQKEHWRTWIRSALELKFNADIPVIDWELEAKLLAEMGIHVFTVQGIGKNEKPEDEDEGTTFFRRAAEITQGQHVKVSDPSRLVEIILGICCACHGPDLLLDHRDTVRDDNDGILPSQLTEVFMSLQLHSKSCSLASLPSLLGNLDIAGMRQRLANSQASIMECSDEEEEPMDEEDVRNSLSKKTTSSSKTKENGTALKQRKSQKMEKKPKKDGKRLGIKGGGVKKGGGIKKNLVVSNNKTHKKIKQAVKAITKGKIVKDSAKKPYGKKRKDANGIRDKSDAKPSSEAKVKKNKERLPPKKQSEKSTPLKRKANDSSKGTKKLKSSTPSANGKNEVSSIRAKGKPLDKTLKNNKIAKEKTAEKGIVRKRGRPRKDASSNNSSQHSPAGKGKGRIKKEKQNTPQRHGLVKTSKPSTNEKKKNVLERKSLKSPAVTNRASKKIKQAVKAVTKGATAKKKVKDLIKKKTNSCR